MAEGGCGRKVARTTEPPSWSIPIRPRAQHLAQARPPAAHLVLGAQVLAEQAHRADALLAQEGGALAVELRPGMSTMTRRPGGMKVAGMGVNGLGSVRR
jgi:hypothetical protein